MLHGYRLFCCFIIHLKIEDVYEGSTTDIKKRFDASNYEVNRPLPIRRNKKSNWINERWIRRKIMSLLHVDQRLILV